MRLIAVDGADDPRLADFHDVRDKDQRTAGVFLVEGAVPVLHFLERSAMQARSVLLSARRLDALGDRIEACAGTTPVYVLPQEQMDELVGFPIHRGVLAAGQRPTPPPLAELLSRARLVLALEGLTNHDNVGACFRNAAAFGADAVVLDRRTADPLYRKSIRVSSGAALTTPWGVADDGPALVRACQDAGLRVVGLTPDARSQPLAEVLTAGPTALLVGTEGPGLTAATLQRVDCWGRIPMAPGFDSLNVATAAAVGLALYRDKGGVV